MNFRFTGIMCIFEAMINRTLSEQLVKFTNHFPVVGVLGPRQVGKTTLVKQNLELFHKQVVYIDLESPEDYNKLTNPELYLNDLQDTLVILDEIQIKPDLFPVLRSLIDRKRVPGRFIILGSASPDIIRDSSESLAGRITYLELQPFSINEISEVADVESLWLKGGFPNALLSEDEISIQWMRSFIRSYVERDLPLLGLGAPVRVIENLWNMLAHINGNIINYTQLSRGLGVSSNSVRSYVQFFQNSFLVRLLKPWSSNTGKRLVKSPKLLFIDSGILHHLLKIYDRPTLLGNPHVGNSWKSFVIQQIICNIPIAVEPYFYRTQDGSEIDLLLVRGESILAAIEVKFSNAPKLTRGNTVAIETLESKRNYIVTPSFDYYRIREDIWVCSVGHFVNIVLPELIG
ncbi:MAG: ATP-binding protein [Prolixibacteraceae bacterium]